MGQLSFLKRRFEMSHVAKIEIEILDLKSLKLACDQLGLEFIEGQKSYAWFGESIGDYPLPAGFTVADLGKCDHAIRVPGAEYEIGVVHRAGKYALLWDSWGRGGLERILGTGAGKLKQAYAVTKTICEAKRKGYMVKEQKTETGIRLVLSGGRA
jgi:hypothetical protein